MRQTWSFDVVVPVGAMPATVPLQITSHANNAFSRHSELPAHPDI